MTHTEKKQPRFGVNDDVYILDNEIYDTPKWIHGVVEEVGEETILVKWDDLTDPTEYELSDLPDIRHTPEGEKEVIQDLLASLNEAIECITEMPTYPKATQLMGKWLKVINKANLLINDNLQTPAP